MYGNVLIKQIQLRKYIYTNNYIQNNEFFLLKRIVSNCKFDSIRFD